MRMMSLYSKICWRYNIEWVTLVAVTAIAWCSANLPPSPMKRWGQFTRHKSTNEQTLVHVVDHRSTCGQTFREINVRLTYNYIHTLIMTHSHSTHVTDIDMTTSKSTYIPKCTCSWQLHMYKHDMRLSHAHGIGSYRCYTYHRHTHTLVLFQDKLYVVHILP